VLTALTDIFRARWFPSNIPFAKIRIWWASLTWSPNRHFITTPVLLQTPYLCPNRYRQRNSARAELLEALADFDDHLLEELLEEIEPPQEEIVKDLKMELGADLIVPVLWHCQRTTMGCAPCSMPWWQKPPLRKRPRKSWHQGQSRQNPGPGDQDLLYPSGGQAVAGAGVAG
jgi:hypothetical protein